MQTLWRPLVLLVLVLAFFPACGKIGKKKSVPSPSDKVFTVSTVKATSQTIPDVIEIKGFFNAAQRITLKSDFTGRVQALSVIEGQSLVTGDAILKVEDDKLTYVLDRQRAELKEAEAQLELDNRLTSGVATVEETEEEADEEDQDTAPRVPPIETDVVPADTTIPPPGVPAPVSPQDAGGIWQAEAPPPVPGAPISPSDAGGIIENPPEREMVTGQEDIFANEQEAASATLRSRLRQNRLAARRAAIAQNRTITTTTTTAQENPDVQESRLSLDQAKVDRLKAEIALTERQLAGSTLASPIDGFVGKVAVTEGALVKPEDLLVEILQIDPIELTIKVPKEQIDKLDKSMEVKVNVPDLPGQSFPGEISFIGAELDKDRKSVEVRIRVANPNFKIKVGMEGNAELGIAGKTHQAILIPPDAIITDKDKKYAYVVEGSLAEKREIVTGSFYEGQVEIKEGLKAAEAVVIRGQDALKEDEEFVKVSN